MKRILFLAFLSFFFYSCKTSSVTATKLDRHSQVDIKGNWVITSVTYPGSEYFKVNSFKIADSKCFVGSKWKFISNNNKGEMNLNVANCPLFNSPITWFVNKEGQFVLKFVNLYEKSKNVRDGFVLTLANQTDHSFQLVDKVNVQGSVADIIYQFERE